MSATQDHENLPTASSASISATQSHDSPAARPANEPSVEGGAPGAVAAIAVAPPLGFIVLTHCRNQTHVDNLVECIRSVRKFHATEPIVILDDGSVVPLVLPSKLTTNLTFGKTKHTGSAEIGIWQYYHDHKFCDKAVFLQDTMYLCGTLTGTEEFPFKFIWNNTAHQASCVIYEPQTTFNRENKIVTHDDLAAYMVRTFMKNDAFRAYFDGMLPQKHKWMCGWASLAIMSHAFLVEFQKQTTLLNVVPFVDNRRKRCALEMVVGILAQFYGGLPLATSYDGLIWSHRVGTGQGWKSARFWRKENITMRFCPCEGCRNGNSLKCH